MCKQEQVPCTYTHTINFLLEEHWSILVSWTCLYNRPILFMTCFLTINSFDLIWILCFSPLCLLPCLTWGQLFLFTPCILSQSCKGHTQRWNHDSVPAVISKVLLAAVRAHSPLLPSPGGTPGSCLVPTWKAQDGEVGPAFGEPWALPHAALPEPFILEHGGDRVVVQVLGAPRVHPRGSDAARQAQDGQEEAHQLVCGGGHGFCLWHSGCCLGTSATFLLWKVWSYRAPEGSRSNQMVSLSSWCLLTVFSLDSSVSLLVQGHYFFIC